MRSRGVLPWTQHAWISTLVEERAPTLRRFRASGALQGTPTLEKGTVDVGLTHQHPIGDGQWTLTQYTPAIVHVRLEWRLDPPTTTSLLQRALAPLVRVARRFSHHRAMGLVQKRLAQELERRRLQRATVITGAEAERLYAATHPRPVVPGGPVG